MKDNRIFLIEYAIGSTSIVKKDTDSLMESFSLDESLNGLPESVNEKSILIKGPVQRANVENKNRRIYPRTILDREMYRLQESIKNRGGFLGELDHPQIGTVELQRVPMVVRKLWWDNKAKDDMMGIVEILNPTLNPYAGIAYSILEAGIDLGISSRGLGSVNSRNNISVVQEDFEMLTFDLVSDPSTHNAYLRHFKADKITEALDINSDLKKEINGWHMAKNESEELNTLLDRLTIKW